MINLKAFDCTGCTACYNVCPHTAIQMVEDSEGFKFPQIDTAKCTNCGLCEKVCIPSNGYVKQPFETKAYGAKNKNLSERILEVCFVTNSLGEKVNFKVYPEYVKTAKGYVVIEYQYMPKPLTKSSEVFFSNNKLTERIIAYGVASEYALIENRFEESNMWDERFKQSLMVVLHPKNLKIKKRRWL